MQKIRLLPFATALATGLSVSQAGALDGVVASIKPIHSLVSAVMEGVAEPELLVKGAASPHAFSMRPSEAGMLEGASVVFWIGPGLDTFLERPLDTLAGGARIVALSGTPGLTLLDMREGGAFEGHRHDEDEEAHAHHDDDHDHEASENDHHAHGAKDMHIWLDPENARLMVRQIASTLSEADPANAAAYEANAGEVEARLDRLVGQTKETLTGVTGPFVVFHDAYHYFEHSFGLEAAGSLTVSPEVLPGAQRLAEIRDQIAELDAACVFAEPQFEPKLIEVVTEGTNARAGILDPLGAAIEDGPELYFTLVGNLARSLAECLSGE